MAIVDDSSPTLSVGTLESHSSFHSSPPTIEAEITSTTSPETLSEHVSGSTTNANTYSPSDQTAGAQVETTGADTIETTYTSLFPESTTQHTVSPFDTSTNAPFSNEQTTQSIQHSSPERKTILSESTSSTYVDFSSEVTSEPKTSDSTTNTQLLSSTGTSTNALLDTTTEESTSLAVSTTVSDSETSTLSHVSKTDTTSLVSTAVSTLVFESSTPMPSQHSSESISQNTEQGTITNTNAYFSTEKASQANLDTTTEEPEDDTVVTQITNGTVQCTCVCRTVNRTLEESIELRKKALSVKHKELSSNLRKRTSAPDFRPSSKAMGSFGIAVLITVVAVIVISDVVSAFVGRAHVADSAEVKSSALKSSPLPATWGNAFVGPTQVVFRTRTRTVVIPAQGGRRTYGHYVDNRTKVRPLFTLSQRGSDNSP
uniref:Mucin-3A-like n=1 Tax=Crassostrea virginica TaxID=6565 RepID=A0A8B8C8H4_CRAVI|nr:mucin-3A-like [Crassostrea virginica]